MMTGGHDAMPEPTPREVNRRRFLQTAAALAAIPILGGARATEAQAPAKVTKVLDFSTGADVAKAEQEGEVVYYGHDGEAAIAVLLGAFRKDFPKIKTNYVRLQTGALYAKITAERSANRYLVDVLQLSDISPAIDFQKKGGYESYLSPEYAAYKPAYLSSPPGSFAWVGVTFAGIAYNRGKVKPEQAPKTWKDILNPAFKDGISAKLAASGMQHAQWYMLRKLYGNDFWQEFAKQRPRGFDARAQLFDRLAKGDDRVCALAEYAGYTLFKEKGADIDFVAPPDGLPATPAILGVVNRAPHPEAAKLFQDWAVSNRGQAVYQNQSILLYGSLRSDAPPMPTGKKLSDFKLLFPSDWADFQASHAAFVKEWNGIMGL
jgi:iron(III) transport system substrate-binding protein